MHGPWCNLESQLGWILIGGKIEGQPTAKVRALRTFPWLSGLLSIGLITLLSAAMGIPRAGLAAGLIMAMHPLHIHWSLEVGGLSTMLMSLTVAMLCMLQVFRTNRWRWWAGLAAAQTVCMLCHGSAAFGLVALDVAAIIVFMKSGATKSAVWSHNRRLFVAAMLTLLAFVTVIPTESQWSWGIKKSFWPGLLSGVSGTGSGTGLDSLIQEPVWRSWMVWGILPLCSLAGLVALLIQDWRTRFVGGSLAGASLLAWFIGGPAAALPFALLLLPLSLAWSGTWLMRLFPAVPRMAHAPVAAAVLFVMTTAPALQRTLAVPNSPLKDVVATAGGRDEQQPGTITAFFGYYHATARFADPGVVFIDRLATLRKLVDDAFDHGQPLYVYHSLNQNTLIDWPHTVKELQTSGRFLLVREFPAFDPRQNIRLYKYQPREQIIRLNVKPEKKPEP